MELQRNHNYKENNTSRGNLFSLYIRLVKSKNIIRVYSDGTVTVRFEIIILNIRTELNNKIVRFEYPTKENEYPTDFFEK